MQTKVSAWGDSNESAWTWNDQRDQWYYHKFHESQPDLNLDNPDVREDLMVRTKPRSSVSYYTKSFLINSSADIGVLAEQRSRWFSYLWDSIFLWRSRSTRRARSLGTWVYFWPREECRIAVRYSCIRWRLDCSE